MTLNEFVNEPINRGYLDHRYNEMREHLEMMKIDSCNHSLFHNSIVHEKYNYIVGYIRAANVYGHLSDDDCRSILSELSEESFL